MPIVVVVGLCDDRSLLTLYKDMVGDHCLKDWYAISTLFSCSFMYIIIISLQGRIQDFGRAGGELNMAHSCAHAQPL